MTKKIKHTLPEQIMQQHGVVYDSLQLNILDKTAAEQVAILQTFNLKLGQIHKTLAVTGDKTGPLIAVIPINQHLSMKKLAQASSNKKVQMIPLKDLQKTTGYVHGANNPVGIWHSKHFPIYIEEESKTMENIVVSAGEIGRSDKINPESLAKLVSGRFVNLVDA